MAGRLPQNWQSTQNHILRKKKFTEHPVYHILGENLHVLSNNIPLSHYLNLLFHMDTKGQRQKSGSFGRYAPQQDGGGVYCQNKTFCIKNTINPHKISIKTFFIYVFCPV